MHQFIYDIPVKVYFGPNQLSHLPQEIRRFGSRVLLTYGGGSIKKSGLFDAVVQQLQEAGIPYVELPGISSNPEVECVRKGAALCKAHQLDLVLAVGGGSVMDASKWIAASALVHHDPWDFFVADAPVNGALPVLTIPTMAATGSEMNAAGVISNHATKQKLGRIAAPTLFPKVSFLDPTNTFSLPPYQTACGAVDIMSHVMEGYFHLDDLFFLDRMMEGVLKTVLHYAPIALQNPNDYEARANLLWASSWGMNGFFKVSKLQKSSCHPMEHEISARFNTTHGHGLAILTPRWMEYCCNEKTAFKFAQFGTNVFGLDASMGEKALAHAAIDALSSFFFETLALPSTLSEMGVPQDAPWDEMAAAACGNGILKGFQHLQKQDIKTIYEMSR